jgi:LEA14-like dessication related protein
MAHFRSAILLLCTLALVAGCANVGVLDFDEPEVELLALEPLPSQGMEARFLVRLRIVNPNSIPLEIEGMAYDISIRDSKILSGVSNQAMKVGAYDEGVAELEVAAGMFGSLALLRDLMSNPVAGGLPYKLNAKLSRRGLGGTLRVSREGQINISAR